MRGTILRDGQKELAHDVNRSAVHERIGGTGAGSKGSLSSRESDMHALQDDVGKDRRKWARVVICVCVVLTWQMGVLKNSMQ